MPPKNCGACQKMVYPMDELKCLDKTWHKACFKCQVCSMTLNMKNYKGYNKLPYCNAHYPTTKFTAVADTPENMRIKQNTKIQSNVTYHAEFEAARGQYTAVADDPETMRVKKNMNTISNVAYHGDMMRKKEMENARPTEIEATSPTSPTGATPAPRAPRQPKSISDYDPMGESQGRPSPFTSKPQSTTVYSSANGQSQREIVSLGNSAPPSRPPVTGQPAPQFTQPAAPKAAPRHASPVRAVTPPPVREPTPPPVRQPSPPPVRQPSPPPVREPTPPPVREPTPPPVRQPSPPPMRAATPPPMREPSPVRQPSPPPIRHSPPPRQRTPSPVNQYAGKGKVSKALYDYAAADDDEVEFEENDIIIHCDPIDDGWMNGKVEKTGAFGMLPSNYVEKLNW